MSTLGKTHKTFFSHAFSSLFLMSVLVSCSSHSESSTSQGTTPPVTSADPGAGGIWVTASGEHAMGEGFPWSPSGFETGEGASFVDGWSIDFEHVIVTFSDIEISEDPDKNSANPADLGQNIAQAKGPFAVDLKQGTLQGKSGEDGEKSVPLAGFKKMTSGASFDPSKRYAFSYQTKSASVDATPVNLNAEALSLYEEAKTNAWAILLTGTASYSAPESFATGVFAKLPKKVHFKFGFANPAKYINCQNTDLQAVGSEFPRGIQVNAQTSTVAQITFHFDHLFWSKLNVEGSELHFDPIAANASTYGAPDSLGEVTLEDLKKVDITAFSTKEGEPLPARSTLSSWVAPQGTLNFSANGTSFSKVNSFASYLHASLTSGGHFNLDGECEVRPQFAP